MFHMLYTTRIKILLREKSNLFWTLFFPIILSIFFHAVLTNAYGGDVIKPIDIALINDTESSDSNYQEFDTTMQAIEISEGEKLFNIRHTSEEKAKGLLEDDKISGYILYDNGLNLVVKESGINESIIKSILETYAKVTKTVQTLFVINGELISNEEIETLYNGGDYVVEVNASMNKPDLVLNHYYSLIAMACLFGSMFGLREVNDFQANLSTKGARLNASPVNKIKLAASGISAAYTLQLVSILLLIAFLKFILKVDFGERVPFILLTSVIGSFTGVLLGTAIGSLSKKNEDFKSSLLTSISLLGCFLAGLMFVQMKYIVATKLPFLQYINPANLITDALYGLYFYDSLDRFILNIIILSVINVILAVITFCSVRRSRYASL